MKLLLRFLCLEVLPVCLRREVKPFIIWFYPPWLDYDVSMDEVVELVGGDSNEPKIIKNGVRMKKLSPFSYCNLFKLEFLLRT
jgi:hypothetical protein